MPFGVSTKLHFAVFLIYILQKGKHVSTDVQNPMCTSDQRMQLLFFMVFIMVS